MSKDVRDYYYFTLLRLRKTQTNRDLVIRVFLRLPALFAVCLVLLLILIG